MLHVTKITSLLLLCCCVLCGCGSQDFLLTTESGKEQAEESLQTETVVSQEDAETAQAESEETKESAQVYVYVCGAVNQSGVYELPADARKEAAVSMAGGFREDADDTYVNLAESVTDGERIYIPTKDETAEMQLSGSETGESQEAYESGKVNINTADRDELMTLPGIGESKADAIIEYRESRGKFTSAEELMNISGIKEGVYNKIKDRIIVG